MCCSSVLGGPSGPASCVSFGRRGACPPARRPRREPSARRVVSKPGQALRARRHPPHWWRMVRVARQNRVDPGAIRIGYAHVDRLCAYGEVIKLSGCWLPIRMLVSYPCVLVAVGFGLPAWRVGSKPSQALRAHCDAPPEASAETQPRPRDSALCVEGTSGTTKRGPVLTDPHLTYPYSLSPPRPRGVIWGHSRSMDASRPCLRRYFSKSSAQSWWAWS